MKKILLIFSAVLVFCTEQATAQGIIIRHTDGELSLERTPNVEEIIVVPEANTFVFGKWYLGWWQNTATSPATNISFDGTEYMTFAGTELIWGGRTSKPDTYTLSFSGTTGNNPFFRARGKNGTSGSFTWYITKQTDDQLILKDGNVYRYFYKTKELAADVLMDPSHTETKNITNINKYQSGSSNSSKTPMGRHFEDGHKTTDDDRTWLADPTQEPNTVASLTQWVAKTVNLYPYGDPQPADVNQHAIGDCCACAVFASFAYLYPDFIKHIITDNGNKTYTVAMYDPAGQPVDVCVSNKILCDKNGNIGQVTGKNNVVTWATILEKALIKWQTIYKEDPGVEGIGTENVSPLFTGNGDSFAFSPNSLYTSELKTAIEYYLGQGYICVGGFNKADLMCGTLKTVTGHAFTYMLSTQDSSIFGMRNPWGIGDNHEDGVLEIPNNRLIVQTIDARIVSPGAAAPYLRQDLLPYTPPAYVRMATDLGVAPRLLNRHVENPNEETELW